MKKLSLILLFFILILSSCYYLDTEINEVEITSSSYTPKVSITSNIDELDTVKIIDSLLFTYNIEIDTGKLYFADLYLGSYQLTRSGDLTDSLWIYVSKNALPGKYELSLTAYYKTYTGSLADTYNSEFFVADTSWTLNIEPEI